jgi:tRNA modification GTPase
MEKRDTIAALATGKGNAALAIIRISGKKAFGIVQKLVKPENRFLNVLPKEIGIYKFTNFKTQKVIDEVMAIKYLSPKSYTGEDMVEIICHGGEIVINEILSALIEEKIVIAQRGEFTKRAYLNGKMELLKAESIDKIIMSNSKTQHEIALNAFRGYTFKKVIEWKEQIKKIIIELEAKIEFPEEDDIAAISGHWKDTIRTINECIKKEILNREKIKYLEKGIKIPIVGTTNAGKSTLFNMLLGFERAIVHHEEGTTRDAISEEILIAGEKIKIYDTAGLHETENNVEKIGIKKSFELIEEAAIIILVTPGNKKMTEFERNILEKKGKTKIIGIISKKDLSVNKEKQALLSRLEIENIIVSLIDHHEKDALFSFLKEIIEKEINQNKTENCMIFSKRQEEIFYRMKEKTEEVVGKGIFLGEEIVSKLLRELLDEIAELVGETTTEDILNSIFDNFCIGK